MHNHGMQSCIPCPFFKAVIYVNLRVSTLHWRHNGYDSLSNHQPYDCLLNRLFRRRSKKTSKLHVTGLCAGNSPGPGEFPAQMASNAENVSHGVYIGHTIWWRHHESYAKLLYVLTYTHTINSDETANRRPLFLRPLELGAGHIAQRK